MTDQSSGFEGFALVEIMGHQQVAGFVTTERFGNVTMFRVRLDAGPAEERTLYKREWCEAAVEYLYPGSRLRITPKAVDRFVGAGSVYQMHPITEAQARARQPFETEVIERVVPPVAQIAKESVVAPDFGDDLDFEAEEDEDGKAAAHEDGE